MKKFKDLKSFVGADEATDTPPDKVAATTDCVPVREKTMIRLDLTSYCLVFSVRDQK